MARGCPQGGVLLALHDNEYHTIRYVDDIANLINGKFSQTMPEALQTDLGIVLQRCNRTTFSINPNKMVIIPFTRKRDIKGLKEPTLFNKIIQLSSEVKYLRLMLHKGLTWKKQLGKVTSEAYRAFLTGRGMFGRICGLRP